MLKLYHFLLLIKFSQKYNLIPSFLIKLEEDCYKYTLTQKIYKSLNIILN